MEKTEKRPNSVELGLADATNGAETLLELIDTTFGIHKLSKSSEERMGVGGDTDRDEAVFHTVDNFLFLGGLGRTGNEAFSGGHIDEDDRIVLRMKVLFHERFW